jgi:hypothetical protein
MKQNCNVDEQTQLNNILVKAKSEGIEKVCYVKVSSQNLEKKIEAMNLLQKAMEINQKILVDSRNLVYQSLCSKTYSLKVWTKQGKRKKLRYVNPQMMEILKPLKNLKTGIKFCTPISNVNLYEGDMGIQVFDFLEHEESCFDLKGEK